MTDLFTDTPTPAVVAPVVVADPLLSTIVNEEGKPKYSSVQDALKALASSQAHIKTLESENSQLREAKTTALTLEDVLKAIKPSADTAPAPVAAPPKPADEQDIPTIVANALAKIETEKTAAKNVALVVEKMKETFGDAASTSFYTKAAELGFDKADINALAQKNPSAVFKLLGIEDKKPTNKPTGSIRTDAFVNPPTSQPKRSGMANGSTKDLVSEWQRVKDKVNQELGIK